MDKLPAFSSIGYYSNIRHLWHRVLIFAFLNCKNFFIHLKDSGRFSTDDNHSKKKIILCNCIEPLELLSVLGRFEYRGDNFLWRLLQTLLVSCSYNNISHKVKYLYLNRDLTIKRLIMTQLATTSQFVSTTGSCRRRITGMNFSFFWLRRIKLR